MSCHFYAMLSRMKHINRWGLMRNSRYENLSEHSFDVAVIAHSLALIKNTRFGGSVDVGKVLAAALYHDMGEIMHGDLPTPVKYYNEELTRAYRKIEEISLERMLAMLPEDLRGAYREAAEGGEGDVRALVKAADKISALIKCMEELRMGNGDFYSAHRSIRELLEQNREPEVRVFLEEFLPSYGLEIDHMGGVE